MCVRRVAPKTHVHLVFGSLPPDRRFETLAANNLDFWVYCHRARRISSPPEFLSSYSPCSPLSFCRVCLSLCRPQRSISRAYGPGPKLGRALNRRQTSPLLAALGDQNGPLWNWFTSIRPPFCTEIDRAPISGIDVCKRLHVPECHYISVN